MKYTISAFILAGLLPVLAFSQAPADAGEAINRLELARRNRPIESVHLHFDKPYYVQGDTIYFKSYVTMNEQHRPTPLSEVLHVDLIDPGGSIIESLKLQLKQGCAAGDLVLADTLASGRYRVRAYTRWMRNEGAGLFFDAPVVVGSGGRGAGVASDGGIPDIQFFPEGGELVAGIETKVAFKATGKDGLGVRVKGVVVDETGKEVTRFQAVHLGMGFFYLRPVAGKSYRATINFTDGSSVKVDLPKAAPAGMVLAAENDSVMHVLANDAFLQTHPNENIAVLICSNGGSSVAKVVLSKGDLDFVIDRQHMHPGITRVTLFSGLGIPVSERLVFIKGPDSLNVAVHSDKPEYGKREKVELSVDAREAAGGKVQGNFSVSVVNGDLLQPDENSEKTIFADLLLCSELRGYIEQPNYYFSHSGDEVDASLDLLLLTQGYRHFIWKKILGDSLPALAFKAEKYLQMQGYVRMADGKPAVGEMVTLTDSSGGGPQQTVKTDNEGRFAFNNLVFMDTLHFFLRASKPGAHIFLTSALAPAVDKEAAFGMLPGMDNRMSEYARVAAQEHQIKGSARAQVLKSVVVRNQNPPDEAYYTRSLAGAGHADQVLQANDLHGGSTLGEALNGRLSGVTMVRGRPILNSELANGSAAGHRMAVVVDGVEIDMTTSLDAIPVTNIQTVEVLRSANSSMYGMSGGVGVLVVTTKLGDELEAGQAQDNKGLYGSYVGFYKSREFYSPRYGVAGGNDKGPDVRTTVCWKPELMTDKDGKASFSFYTGDLPGDYRVVVEGIDANGNLGRQVYRFVVR